MQTCADAVLCKDRNCMRRPQRNWPLSIIKRDPQNKGAEGAGERAQQCCDYMQPFRMIA